VQGRVRRGEKRRKAELSEHLKKRRGRSRALQEWG
jgi:hypothetical protein